MVSVHIVTEEGCLVLAEAEGHAGTGRYGNDLVCAAISVLFRTTADVLEKKIPSVSVETAGRGTLRIRTGKISSENRCCLLYAAEFLCSGISSLSEEFPDALELRMESL